MPRILVIEDDRPIRDVILRLLSAAGYETLAAGSGAHGLQLWREHGADLVLTDIGLADMDGLDIVVQLRAASPRLPLVVMSGDTSRAFDALRRAPGLAPIKFLPKPFVRAQLLAVVAECLGATDEQNARRSGQGGTAGD